MENNTDCLKHPCTAVKTDELKMRHAQTCNSKRSPSLTLVWDQQVHVLN